MLNYLKPSKTRKNSTKAEPVQHETSETEILVKSTFEQINNILSEMTYVIASQVCSCFQECIIM